MRKPDDSDFGALLSIERPIAHWKAWAVIIVLGLLIGGWPLWFLVDSGVPWAYAVPSGLIGIVLALYILGERTLLEQRLYERALVSRSLVPFVGSYAIPLAAVDPDTIEVTPRFRWTDEGETHLPASRSLRSKPWGPVVRFRAPAPASLKRRRRRDGLVVPASIDDVNLVDHRADNSWIFSFTDVDAAAARLRELVQAEWDRLGPYMPPYFDPRKYERATD